MRKYNDLKNKFVSLRFFVAFILVAASLIMFSTSYNGLASYAKSNLLSVVDSADILSESEEKELLTLVNEIVERQKVDVAIVTVEDFNTYEVWDAAEDFYQDNNYGYGDKKDGIMLYISMADRDWAIYTFGYAKEVFTDPPLDRLEESFLDLLGQDKYFEGFKGFAKCVDEEITDHKEGKPDKPFSFVFNLLISLAIGFVVAFIVTNSMKAKLKSVKRQAAATEYTKLGSMKVQQSRDVFLYTTTTKTAKPKSSNHSSSSGGGGRSGKF